RVDRIKASARHLMMIIDEILSFSRLETAREETHIEDFDVVELVRETVGIVDAQASAKGIRLSVDDADAPRHWTTDPGKLRQILLHLTGNAIKFTDQGEVAVVVKLAGDALVLAVRDTGPGIAPDEIERIFQPFTQIDQSMTRVKDGAGLGLSVSRRLARLLGGDITVTSERGKGSNFSVTLPRRTAGS
ncbi:MAG: sensor histidine kinase, partial [Longimicrobiales bacterium]